MNYEKWAFHDITPISRQLTQKLIYAILSNELSSGDSIPSVREMAEILHINPNTVLKSYKAVKQVIFPFSQSTIPAVECRFLPADTLPCKLQRSSLLFP